MLGGWELIMMMLGLLVFLAVLAGIVALVMLLIKMSNPLANQNKGAQAAPAPNPAPKSPAPPVPTSTVVMGRKCPQCGAELKPDAPEGLCPACLLQRGIATEGGEAAAGKAPFVPPPVSELAALFPQLEILGCLGRGGMGAVYKARQPRLDRFVALKILSPEKQNDAQFAERFGREARALARLNHPNIVAVYDFGEVQGRFYLLMEFVDGVTLRQVLQAGKLAPPEALKIVPKICEALQYAHEQGIVHRDIKPENILVDKQGRVKIADFGIAKITGLEPKDMGLTGVRDIMGTPHYMAPEQVEQPQAVDHRADIYSLGVVFYEMLTGELPLGKFAPPSEKAAMDVRLDQVVMHALEKEPARRYQQANQVKTDVETIASGPGQTSTPATPGAPATIKPLIASSGSNSEKAILPAFLLAFFFGVFGAHRFYVGKIWTGLTQLAGVGLCIFFIIICALTNSDSAHVIFGVSLGFLIIGCGVWAMIDWILLACRAFTDGEGKRINYWIQPVNGGSQFGAQPGIGQQTNASSMGGGMGGAGGGAGGSAGTMNPFAPVGVAANVNKMMITAPAVALMVMGGWKILSALTALVSVAFFSSSLGWLSSFDFFPGMFGGWAPVAMSSIVLFKLVPGLLIIFGGYQMLEMRSHAWGVAAGIIAIVSCSLISLPVGIWALIVLAREDVRAAFGEALPGTTPTSASARGFGWVLATIAVVAIVALLLMGWFGTMFFRHIPRMFPGGGSSANSANGQMTAFSELTSQELTQANIHEEGGEFRKDFDQSLPLTADGKFSLDNVNGRVEIHGWSSNVVEIHARIHGSSSAGVNGVKINVDPAPDNVVVHTQMPSDNGKGFWDQLWSHTFQQGVSVDYEVHAPQGCQLGNVSSVNGTVVIDGISGDIEASTVNGRAELKDVMGNLQLSTVNGHLSVVMAKLDRGQKVSVDTVNGAVELAVPTNADASFSVSTLNGGIASDFPELKPQKDFPVGRHLNANLGNGSATVKATTVNGGVSVKRMTNDE